VDDEPDDEDFAPFPRQRRHPRLRWFSLVVAVALLVGIVGSTVGLVASGGGSGSSGREEVQASILSVAGLPAGAATATQALVTISAVNRSGSPLAPVCTIHVLAGGDVVGDITVHAEHTLGTGQSVTAQLTVPLLHPTSSVELGKGRVSC